MEGFNKPYWKYLNGFTDKLKEKACKRIDSIEHQFKHDKDHKTLIQEEYIKICVNDGLFESIEDFEGAILAHKIRSQIKPTIDNG